MEQFTGSMTSQFHVEARTYFLISATEENIQHKQGSSSGILIFLGNKQGPVNILPPQRNGQENPSWAKTFKVGYLFGQRSWPLLHFNLLKS